MPSLLSEANTVSSSPYINRFVSVDTFVPNPVNPQSLNRYSYVNNNPLRYTDPTGHRACGDGEAISCETGLLNNPSDHKNIGCGGPGQKSCQGVTKKEDKDKEEFIKNLNEWAIGLQDAATFVDAGFATIEVGLAAGLCFATIEAGCVEGALGGLLWGQAIFNFSGGNGLETGLSLTSLVLTVAADGLDDGQLGEATTTSAVTFGIGTMMIDPIADLFVDGYASGYNHGVFNGIETLFNGGTFFQDSFLSFFE